MLAPAAPDEEGSKVGRVAAFVPLGGLATLPHSPVLELQAELLVVREGKPLWIHELPVQL